SSDLDPKKPQPMPMPGEQPGGPGDPGKRPMPGEPGGPGDPGGKKPGDPGGDLPRPGGGTDPYRSEAYLTVQPALRDLLLRMEVKGDGERVLFSSACHVWAAILRGTNADDFGKITFRTRAMWDVINLLDEKSDRLKYA